MSRPAPSGAAAPVTARPEPPPGNEAELEERLSRPSPGVLSAVERHPGDILVLGAGGKMGPSLARMARRAIETLGRDDRVFAVSRFSDAAAADALRRDGVTPVRCDLTDRDAVRALPDAPNVVFMAGQKFGTTAGPGSTWIANTVLPAIAAERYATSRLVAFSTGNVYPLVPVDSGGASESHQVGPIGEYAASCLGRERVLSHIAAEHDTPLAIVRLNYAVDLRYGVLVDVARKVAHGEPIDLAMGHVNVIWQGDANAMALQCLAHAAVPPFVVNVTGPETLSIRAVATRFGELLGRDPVLVGTEAPDALLSDARLAFRLFDPPTVPTSTLIDWVADWIRRGGRLLGKPTRFEERAGRF